MLVHLDVELTEQENAYLEDCIAARRKGLPIPNSTTLSWDTEVFIRVAAEWVSMGRSSDEGALPREVQAILRKNLNPPSVILLAESLMPSRFGGP